MAINKDKGNIAAALAHAPLVHAEPVVTVQAGNDMRTAMETAIIDQMQAGQAEAIKAVVLPFKLVGFKLNGKAKDYPGDDDPTVISRKVAFGICQITGSNFRFMVSIYRNRHTAVTNAQGQIKTITRCTMPNSGKMGGFRPILDTDDAREERALDTFRAEVATSFKAWVKAQEGGQQAVSTAGRTHADDIVDFE